MSFEISGKLIAKYDTAAISDKFKKREFVLEKKENSSGFEFVDYIKFQLIQEKCAILDPYKTGDELKVSFNLRGRKWEKDGTTSFFTNLEAWKIEKLNLDENSVTFSGPPENHAPMPGEEDFTSTGQEMDDLPF